MSNNLSKRIEAAVDAAPYRDPAASSTPYVELATVADGPSSIYYKDDYDVVTLNEGLTPLPNSVLVTADEYPELFQAYGDFLSRQGGSLGDYDINETIRHEREHGRVFEALHAREVRYGMRFSKTQDPETGQEGIDMTAYTTAELMTIKLGAGAMLLGPQDPSESDLVAARNIGYEPESLAEKLWIHKQNQGYPDIPMPSWAKKPSLPRRIGFTMRRVLGD